MALSSERLRYQGWRDGLPHILPNGLRVLLSPHDHQSFLEEQARFPIPGQHNHSLLVPVRIYLQDKSPGYRPLLTKYNDQNGIPDAQLFPASRHSPKVLPCLNHVARLANMHSILPVLLLNLSIHTPPLTLLCRTTHRLPSLMDTNSREDNHIRGQAIVHHTIGRRFLLVLIRATLQQGMAMLKVKATTNRGKGEAICPRKPPTS
jgi:hypothetical protein